MNTPSTGVVRGWRCRCHPVLATLPRSRVWRGKRGFGKSYVTHLSWTDNAVTHFFWFSSRTLISMAKLRRFAGLVAVSICSARQINGFVGYVIIHVYFLL